MARRNFDPDDDRLEAEVGREVARIREEHQVALPHGRCRVCQNPESRQKVNTLLAYGLTNPEILRFVEDINERRSKNNKITLDSIRNHKYRHFNVQAPTQAGFRRILERRRSQLSDEYADASETMLTGMAFLQVMAEKGWRHLIDDDTTVPYEDGVKALLKLEEMQREGHIEEKIAQMRRDVGLLQQAVREVVPEEYYAAISERINELTGQSNPSASRAEPEIVDAEVVDFWDQDDDDEEAFSPVMEADAGDSIEE